MVSVIEDEQFSIAKQTIDRLLKYNICFFVVAYSLTTLPVHNRVLFTKKIA